MKNLTKAGTLAGLIIILELFWIYFDNMLLNMMLTPIIAILAFFGIKYLFDSDWEDGEDG